MYNNSSAIIVDTHDMVRKLMDTEMSEAQAEALADMQIKLIEYQKYQLDQHLQQYQQYREQFATKNEVQHLEDKAETKFNHLEDQIDARFQPMEERLDTSTEQLEERFDDNLSQLEERFNNKLEQLNGKIEQQTAQFTIIVGGIIVTAIGVVLPFSTYIIGLFK